MKITPQDIANARKRIAPYITHTPTEFSPDFSEEAGTNVFLKLENLQVSGSFKPRGGLNKILKEKEKNPHSEFVAPTAGGHSAGLSYAAKILGSKVHILMPESADSDRKKDIANKGAKIQTFESVTKARHEAQRLSTEKGYVYVSAYNDTEMIEGGGTMALELIEQLPELDCLVCGVGGGGYIAGMAVVLKAYNPNIKIFGAQQENAPFLAERFKTKKYPENLPMKPSIAEGIGAEVEHDSLTWPFIEELVDDFFVVTEEEISETVIKMLKYYKHYVEPSAVVGLAAIAKNSEFFCQFKNVATIITGRNMSYEKFLKLLK